MGANFLELLLSVSLIGRISGRPSIANPCPFLITHSFPSFLSLNHPPTHPVSYEVLEDSAVEAVQLSSITVGHSSTAQEQNFKVRKNFPETWLWEQFNAESSSGFVFQNI